MKQGSAGAAGQVGFWRLICPYWGSERRWLALTLAGAVLAIAFTQVSVALWLNRLAGQLTDALLLRDWQALKPVFLETLLAAMLSVAMSNGGRLLRQWLAFDWRSWLTASYLDRWTRGKVFYEIERAGTLDNADQRIAEDIDEFTTKTLDLALNCIVASVNIVTFSIVLWGLSGVLQVPLGGITVAIPGYMLIAAVLIVLVELAITHWLGWPLIGLNMRKKQVEADFRHLGMQLREYAEQIAFYHGQRVERERLGRRWRAVHGNWRALQWRTAKFLFGRDLFAETNVVIPTLLAMPRYLSGAISLGGVTRSAGAYNSVRSSLMFFVTAYEIFTQWRAAGNRLGALAAAMARAEHSGEQARIVHAAAGGPVLSTGTLQLWAPDGGLLAQLPPLRIERGQRWLLRGRSGAGKSSVLRALAGLWPFGQGRIGLPDGASLFVPQRSYVPEGSLKAALCYPGRAEDFDDARCLEALRACGLPQLGGCLHQRARWQQRLSGGEQQRLAFVRVLLQRPDFVFLDEVTSALDEDAERELYALLFERLPDSAIVSVAHRASVAALHDDSVEVRPAPR
ncbi:ABC transporter ATP-binding protein/permease [Xanthomonas theicola]|uniref:ABC transporter ATP-binding protein n=1 Tax=Xanthomonas theicola TaxID=56464 RepID=A0A2S6ZCD2_9XANT|nr:ABC transporter ATP-binding protein/permease [Xanthomonas theicola]PPT87756.1 hypothetical protein XthCFBP4691_15175 [Xanthomonas theicola]QNH23918.1 ABC transporter ATP-binding protein/permease [Xanthomonas theicola]